MSAIGQKIVIYRTIGFGERRRQEPIRIVTVERETKTLYICGPSPLCDRLEKRRHSIASDAELKTAEEFIAKERAEDDKWKESAERRRKDPQWQLADILPSYEAEDWHGIGLDRLRQVAEWVSEAKQLRGIKREQG